MMTLLAAGAHKMTAWGQFVAIISKPDNMPVAGALLLVVFFTWLSMRQALKNDRLIAAGRKSEILSEMQK
jgi:formate/nitrite transporter FocA (FNT family)